MVRVDPRVGGAGPVDAGELIAHTRWWNRSGGVLACRRSQRDEAKPPSSSGLGHHPFKVTARVRIPLGVRNTYLNSWSRGEVGVHAGLSSRRSRVRVPSGPLGAAEGRPRCVCGVISVPAHVAGRVAQLAERPPEKRKVTGSTPVSTTTGAFGRLLQFSAS